MPLHPILAACFSDHINRWEAMPQRAQTPDNLQPTFGLGMIYWMSFLYRLSFLIFLLLKLKTNAFIYLKSILEVDSLECVQAQK